MSAYDEEAIGRVLAGIGMTLDQMRDKVPLVHNGPGGCEGVDEFDVYMAVASLIREREIGQ